MPTKWRSYRDHRLCDVASPCVDRRAERRAGRVGALLIIILTELTLEKNMGQTDIVPQREEKTLFYAFRHGRDQCIMLPIVLVLRFIVVIVIRKFLF